MPSSISPKFCVVVFFSFNVRKGWNRCLFSSQKKTWKSVGPYIKAEDYSYINTANIWLATKDWRQGLLQGCENIKCFFLRIQQKKKCIWNQKKGILSCNELWPHNWCIENKSSSCNLNSNYPTNTYFYVCGLWMSGQRKTNKNHFWQT